MRMLVVLLFCCPLWATDFYVSPSGTSGGTGAIGSPWDLQTALNQPAALQAGDTLYLRGGSYTGLFTSKLLGTSPSRITVKPYQNEQPVIDSGGQAGTILELSSTGGFVNYIGLEVKGSAPQRWGTDDLQISFGNCPANGTGVNVLAPNTRVINFKIHDTCDAIFQSRSATDSELYGNIIYNNGTDAPSRGHGHAIYAQNKAPSAAAITQNVILDHWSAALHIYGASAELDNFTVTENIAFSGQHIIGGSLPLTNLVFSSNVVSTGFWSFYYNNEANTTITFNNNTLFASFPAFWWGSITAHGNTIYNPSGGYKFELRSQPSNTVTLDFDSNRYIAAPDTADFIGTVSNADASSIVQYNTFTEWQAAGHDALGDVVDIPTVQELVYYTNTWETKRGHIAVLNWTMSDTALVDLSQIGYTNGDAYSIWDLQAMGDAQPLQSGTWNGTPVSVNLAYTGFTLPTGDSSPQCWTTVRGGCTTCSPIPAGCVTHAAFTPAKTSKQLRAFLVRNLSTTSLPVISGTSYTATGTTATVTWTTDRPTTSQVDYGLTASYGSQTSLDSNLTTSHSVRITGLNKKTTYHYRARSQDSSGNLALSSDLTLKTTARKF